MANAALDPALLAARWAAYADAVGEGYRAHNVTKPKGVDSAIVVTAKRLGIAYNTMRDTIIHAELRGYSLDKPPVKPIAEAHPWRVPALPDGKEPIEELLERRRRTGTRKREADEARGLIPVTIGTPGPIGLMFVGDPHLDNDGCDFALLEAHIQLVAPRRSYLFAADVGDITDGWIGRLARLYAFSSTTKPDAWRLAKWYTQTLNPVVRIRGNHDEWSAGADPLDYMGQDIAVDVAHGARLALQHPCGAVTRVHVRHDFKGNSQFNGLHGLVRETLWGHRDHIIVAGHRHFGEDGAQVTPECITQMVRVSGYKVVDDYAKAGGYKPKKIHPSALVIIDPSRPETCRSRAWCAPTIEDGVDYLDWLRSRFENGGRARVKVSTRGAAQ